MKAIRLGWTVAWTLAAGCSGREEASPMAGMTAEEHARMMTGVQGRSDSTGELARQPVQLTPAEARALGVTYATVAREAVTRSIRTVGQIQAPEPAIAEVTVKVEGFVEALPVNATGETVRRGEPLLTLYSPALVAAQEELLTASRLVAALDAGSAEALRNARAVLEAARRRLLWWDVPEALVADVERTGVVQRTLTLHAPVSGVVLEKMVLLGQRVTPGMPLYRIADLAEVWVEGDVFEQDLRFLHPGAEAHVEVAAYPDQHLMGRVSFVYPTLDPMTRTNRIRLTMANPALRLKPGMFATVYLDVTLGEALMAPMSAVIATGERNLVFVRAPDGTLVPRIVVVGARAGDRIEILEGLSAGETIVRSANFLVDAESRLGGTSAAMPGTQHGPEHAPPPPPPEQRHD